MAAIDLNQAKQLFEEGRLSEAQRQLQQAVEEDENQVDGWYYLALIAFKQDHYEDAITYATRALSIKEDDERIHALLGQAYGLKAQQTGAVKGAMLMPKIRKAFERALELNPESLRAAEGLFMFHLFAPSVSGGNARKTPELLEKIKQLDEARGYMAEALSHIKKQDYEQAATLMEKAADTGARNSEIQMRVGRFFMERNQLQGAENCFKRYIELKPKDAAGYNSMGELKSKMNELQEALNHFNQAVEYNPDSAPAYYNRAEVYMSLGETDLAKNDYRYLAEHFAQSASGRKAKKVLSDLS